MINGIEKQNIEMKNKVEDHEISTISINSVILIEKLMLVGNSLASTGNFKPI